MNKIYKTFKEIRKVARHHYGDNRISIFKFLYYSIFHVNIFAAYYIDLDENLISPELDLKEFKVITDIEYLKKIRDNKELPREFYYDEMHGVGRFYLLISGNEIAYIHWVYVKGDKNRFLYLNDFDAELNYNTTMPKFRGKGIMNHMMRSVLIDLRAQGFKKAYGVVNIENSPAIKSMDRCGFKEFSRIKAIGQLNRKIRL